MDAATDLTRVLAAQASALSYLDLPAPAREIARQCVLDYLGVALAGAGDPLVRILLDELAETGGSPQASVIGDPTRLPALSAIAYGCRWFRRHSSTALQRTRSIMTTSIWRCRVTRRSRSCLDCSLWRS